MLKVSRKEKICHVDSSKFNKVGQSKIFNLNEVDKVITDNNCDSEKREQLANFCVKLIIAEN